MNTVSIIKDNWSFNEVEQLEQYDVWGERLVERFRVDGKNVILKGIGNVDEDIIISNVKAHQFLGNIHGMAPSIIRTKFETSFIYINDYYFYMMSYIDGRQLEDTVEDSIKLGVATRRMHHLNDYAITSPLYSEEKRKKYRSWFDNHNFKEEFNTIIDGLIDFEMNEQCFIHTDVGPHNAKLNADGNVMFVDLDDAGYGPKYLDLGWPFIMQFVDHNKETGEMKYQFDLAVGFLKGYFSSKPIPQKVFDDLWDGAIYMHISYMKVYGPEAVEPLWDILNFGIANKNELYIMYHSSVK